MNRKKIAAHLNSAITQLVPDLFDKVANAPVKKMEKHDHVTRQEEAEKPSYRLQLIAAGVSLMLIMIVFAGWLQFFAAESVITLDINPSIEITMNRKNQVLRMQALNDDGSLLFHDPNVKNKDLDTSIKNIFNAILQMGYMGNEDDIVLVSVQNKNSDNAVRLQNQVTKDIVAFLKETNAKALLLRQTIFPDSKLKQLRADYGISMGKSNLIRQMAACDHSLNIADLATLSLQELLRVIKEQKIKLKEIGIDGIDIRISALVLDFGNGIVENGNAGADNGNGVIDNSSGVFDNGNGKNSDADVAAGDPPGDPSKINENNDNGYANYDNHSGDSGAINDDGAATADDDDEDDLEADDEDDLEAENDDDEDDDVLDDDLDDEDDDELDDELDDEDEVEAEDEEEADDDDESDDSADD